MARTYERTVRILSDGTRITVSRRWFGDYSYRDFIPCRSARKRAHIIDVAMLCDNYEGPGRPFWTVGETRKGITIHGGWDV